MTKDIYINILKSSPFKDDIAFQHGVRQCAVYDEDITPADFDEIVNALEGESDV